MNRDPIGLDDPDDWINRWKSRHRSNLFDGNLARLALAVLESGEDGFGRETLRFTDEGRRIEVDVSYYLETLSAGRVFHVLSILSPGDPYPDDSSDAG